MSTDPTLHGVLDAFAQSFASKPKLKAMEDAGMYADRLVAQMPAEPTKRDISNAIFLAYMQGWTSHV